MNSMAGSQGIGELGNPPRSPDDAAHRMSDQSPTESQGLADSMERVLAHPRDEGENMCSERFDHECHLFKGLADENSLHEPSTGPNPSRLGLAACIQSSVKDASPAVEGEDATVMANSVM